MTEAEARQEAWVDEFMEIEAVLTIFQLLLLMKVATGKQDMGALEPVWPWLAKENEKIPLWQAPFVLDQGALLELAQARELVDRGYLLIPAEKTDFVLTEKGVEAVNWWVGTLENIGFRHETLAADS